MDSAGKADTSPCCAPPKRQPLDEQVFFQLFSGEDPQATIEAQELRQLLQQAFKELTPEERHIIEMRYQHKKSPGQTASQLNIPRKKLQTLERSGLKKIGQHLQAWRNDS